MKVLVGGIGQETNMFSARGVHYQDFHEYTGDGVVRYLFPHLDPNLCDVEFVPAIYANITPSGPLDEDEFGIFLKRFFDAVQCPEEIDAIYLCLHGAMTVKGIGSGEVRLLSEIRKVFGPDILIAASFDFHGNMSSSIAKHLNLCTAYRTAPHTDEEATRLRALKLLLDSYRRGLHPAVDVVKIPIVLPGEKVITADDPTCQVIEQVSHLMDDPSVLDASLFCGYAWADHDDLTMSIAISRTNPCAMQDELLQAANDLWAMRADFTYSVEAGTPDWAVLRAVEWKKANADTKPVFLSDTGDNITAGAAGDCVELLCSLRKNKVSSALVLGLTDSEAVGECFAHKPLDSISLRLGGKIDPQSSSVSVQATLIRCGTLDKKGLVRYALLDVDHVAVVLTNERYAFTKAEDFKTLGLSPADYSVIAIKLGYLYPEIEPLAGKSILALTPGNAPQNIAEVPYRNVHLPIFPKDRDFSYFATDWFFAGNWK